MLVQRLALAASLGISLIGLASSAEDAAPTLAQPEAAQAVPAPEPEVRLEAPKLFRHRLLAQTTVIEAAPPPPTHTTIIEPQPVRTSETSVSYQPRTGLIVGGIVIFGVSYGVTVVASALRNDECNTSKDYSDSYVCRTSTWPLAIPLAGPFIQMGYVEGTGKDTVRALLAVDGVVQIGGVVMALVGLAASGQPASITEHTISQEEQKKIHLMPIAMDGGMGMSAGAAF